jgi:hypothetical protein
VRQRVSPPHVLNATVQHRKPIVSCNWRTGILCTNYNTIAI